jgi:hypothetical protein
MNEPQKRALTRMLLDTYGDAINVRGIIVSPAVAILREARFTSISSIQDIPILGSRPRHTQSILRAMFA